MNNVLTFSDEYAPVWTDPETGERGPWTAARFRAAGFTVRETGQPDLYAVDLGSRRKALEPPVIGHNPPPPDDHATEQ